jgi:secreted trypsin-like serine protease
VAPQWIVTAAHCTFGDGDRPAESMLATVGATDLEASGAERIAVDRFVPNPSYDTERIVNDIALLHLARPTTRPAMPLATPAGVSDARYASPPGVPNAAGFGAVDEEGTELPNQLQQAYLPIRTAAECKAHVSDFDAQTQTCAGASGGDSACFGDSGGPLVEIDQPTGKRVLWGLTSYGPDSGPDVAPCSVDVPTVYTWIPAYTNFIQSTIGSAPAAAPAAATPVARRVGPERGTKCAKARKAARSARAREHRALRRLRVARRNPDRVGAEKRTRLARRYRAARSHRRHAVATAGRRCRRETPS